jgi:hypothetical protein
VGKPCVNKSCGTIANGSVCTSDAQCTSGHCVDGYCCNVACDGSCQACDLAGKEGTCTTLTKGATPHTGHPACTTGACTSSCDGKSAACVFSAGAPCGTCRACDAAGQCKTVPDGTPDAACAASTSGCAVGGCNASGACKAAAAGTTCGAYTCSETGTALGQYTAITHRKKVCDGNLGAAACKAGTNEGCGDLTCDPNKIDCSTSCSNDIDCLAGAYCKGGVCTPWLANGATCTTDNQCASRLCSGNKCVECESSRECFYGFSCTNNKCVSSGSTACTGTTYCGSIRAPSCNATTKLCDCGGKPACAAGQVCKQGECKVPMYMPCKSSAECADAAACLGGVCQPSIGGCARTQDCVKSGLGTICCLYGSGATCSSGCS